MRILTLHQPWATFVALQLKSIETRGWSTDYRGELAIHAGKNPEHLLSFFAEHEVPEAPRPNAYAYPLGAVVALCELRDCRRTEDSGPAALERELGDYSPGRFAWSLRNTRALARPLSFRGSMGLTELREGDAEEIRRRATLGATAAAQTIEAQIEHHCHATGCRVEVPPALLMCSRHWRMVPRQLRDAVYATYRTGQEQTKDPSAAYLQAAMAAITAVQERERATA